MSVILRRFSPRLLDITKPHLGEGMVDTRIIPVRVTAV